MWQRFSPGSRAIILRAQNIALEHNQNCVSPAHFFLALLEVATSDSHLGALLLGVGLKVEEAQLYVEATLNGKCDSPPNGGQRLTLNAKRVLEVAAVDARQSGASYITLEHLLLACLNPRIEPTLVETLAPLGWNLAVLRARQRELNARPSFPDSPLEMLTSNAEAAIENSYKAMRATWCGRISTAHLLLGVLDDERVHELLVEVGASADNLKARTRAEIRSDSQLATPHKRFDVGTKRALDRAKQEALCCGYKFIGPEHILLGLLPKRATLHEKLKWGLQVPDVAATVLAELDADRLRNLLVPSAAERRLQSKKSPSPDVPRSTANFIFFSMMIAGFASSFTLVRSRTGTTLLDIVGPLMFIILLLISSLGACWVLVTSDKPHLKSAWSAAFFGLLLGTMLTISIFMR